MRPSKTDVRSVKDLVMEGKYDEADNILKDLSHPSAAELRQLIETMREEDLASNSVLFQVGWIVGGVVTVSVWGALIGLGFMIANAYGNQQNPVAYWISFGLLLVLNSLFTYAFVTNVPARFQRQ